MDVLSKDQWVQRCQAVLMRDGGLSADQALMCALQCFEDCDDGAQSPEDAAQEEMETWEDDGEE